MFKRKISLGGLWEDDDSRIKTLEVIRALNLNLPLPDGSQDLVDLLVGPNPIHSDKVFVTQGSSFIGTCSDDEKYHWAVLSGDSVWNHPDGWIHPNKLYRRGIWLFVDGEPLGYVKVKGNRTFISARSVIRSDGSVPVIRYGYYSLESELTRQLPHVEKGEWGKKELQSLTLDYRRLIRPEGFKRRESRYRRVIDRELEHITPKVI